MEDRRCKAELDLSKKKKKICIYIYIYIYIYDLNHQVQSGLKMCTKTLVTARSSKIRNVYKLKPVFHCKLGSRWLLNANEMSTNNMKSTWPMQTISIGDPMHPIFHLFTLGFALVVTQIFAFTLGVTQFFAFLDTSMLASPTQNSRVRGIAQHDCLTRVFSRHSGI